MQKYLGNAPCSLFHAPIQNFIQSSTQQLIVH